MVIKITPQVKKKLDKNIFSLSRDYYQTAKKYLYSQKFIRISLLVAITVWTCWLITVEPQTAIKNTRENWEIAVTMVFGSMVAGGTSLGGGAVAFPVLTKILEIPPHEAKVFALAIQTVGMGAASITIFAMKTKLEWQSIPWISLGGIPGIILSAVYLSPIIPPDITKISFSMTIASFALVLLFLKQKNKTCSYYIIDRGAKQKYIFLLIGFVGGIISGLVGSGMDIFAFAVMILLFNICEKVSTATSVVLMAFNSLVGFLVHKFIIADFVAPVSNYWLAAVPVVVVGAPLGAIICNYLNRETIVRILVALISVDLISSILLVPLTVSVMTAGIIVFCSFTILYYFMWRFSSLARI